MNANKSTVAIGYVRVSTDKQDNSVDAQKKLINAQATLKGLALFDVIEDPAEYSGNLDRPGMKRLLDLVNSRKVNAVIITKLDRLTRSTRDAIDLIELFEKKGVALISVHESLDTESPMGRFFVRMIASIAELEREQIGARTSAGMQNLKSQGLPAGTAPFGWSNVNEHDPDGKLIRKPLLRVLHEQEVIHRMRELRAQGLSMAKIAAQLNEDGYVTRSETPWVQQYVHRVMKSISVGGGN